VQSGCFSGRSLLEPPESICLLVTFGAGTTEGEITMAATGSFPRPGTCVHCGNSLILPEWSESFSEEKTIRLWRCLVCGREFETTDGVIEREPSNVELAEEFLPNLVVT
jgi:hypothetical protein